MSEKKLFDLQSKYKPAGDQGEAIDEIEKNLIAGEKFQTLWGVTGSGKTFTMANIINKSNKPTLIIAHNKTLAAQLANEFKEFFPNNAVHYFVSYYDYYQPEAYVAKTDTYIEKEATINAEIDRMRHAATQDLLTRKDVVIVASVSCIYGIGDISLYMEQVFDIKVGEEYILEELLKKLVGMQYRRAGEDFKPGTFQVMGDLLEIFPASSETVLSIEFWGDEITQITDRNYLTGEVYNYLQTAKIFPAKHTVTTKDRILDIVPNIQKELDERLKYFKEDLGDVLKYERLKTKVEYDIEMMKEVGYVNGIENYSRYLDGRPEGDSPATLMDYFGDDFLCLVDESHMTFSQIGGMYAGDRARKTNLVENGFRLPSAMDNRPLKFVEFENKLKQIVAVSATPSKYEIVKSCMNEGDVAEYDSEGKIKLNQGAKDFFDFNIADNQSWKPSKKSRIIPQLIRPTGLLDPEIELHHMEFMVDHIMKNIQEVVELGERMLITTVTKKSSEELADYLTENGIKVKYLHSEVDTLERLEVLRDLRTGKIDVIVGVNLLREGLDLPEVSRIAILDADKQGFLRSESALIQIIGRAARNAKGKVFMYVEKLKNFTYDTDNGAILHGPKGDRKLDQVEENLFRVDKAKLGNNEGFIISEAMRKAIYLTYYRRKLQQAHNEKSGIIPKTVYSAIKDMGIKTKNKDYAILDKKSAEKEIARLELELDIAAANMEYEKAAEIRDELLEIKAGKRK
ncbi:MAG: excinuclease ABC subunit UvrB [Candidatus Gracilibacteria bacterium]|nr:excinuclease ABC subunit UvrB [Candidatus Gracilibacteria bacterium]